MLNFRIEKDTETPNFEAHLRKGKYAAIYAQLAKTADDEWLVVDGFKDSEDMRCVQSSVRAGGSARTLRKYGFVVVTHGVLVDDRIELWLKRQAAPTPA
jgi:hypothetical protein